MRNWIKGSRHWEGWEVWNHIKKKYDNMVVCVSLFLFESMGWFEVEYFTFSCLHVPYIEYHWQVLLPKVQHLSINFLYLESHCSRDTYIVHICRQLTSYMLTIHWPSDSLAVKWVCWCELWPLRSLDVKSPWMSGDQTSVSTMQTR